ncbi:hypothetical protein D3C81_2251130 [compost metagenome]
MIALIGATPRASAYSRANSRFAGWSRYCFGSRFDPDSAWAYRIFSLSGAGAPGW